MQPDLRLQLITAPLPQRFPELQSRVEIALGAGVRCVQLRDKEASTRELAAIGSALLASCRRHGARLLINDRLDLALAIGADGVHLGVDDLPWDRARRLAPPPFIVGVSVDSPLLLQRAIEIGADYCGVGPAHATNTKPDAGRPIEPELFRELNRARGDASIALIAVGGIEPGGAARWLAAGADGVALSRGLLEAPDIDAAVRTLRQELAR